jgi:SagB-type dehydrogenase family enzyme
MIKLPKPRLDAAMSLERAIYLRRSIREFAEDSVSLTQLSQILWAGQGITDDKCGFRASPSAGAVFPMQLWILVDRVEGLKKDGLYVYDPVENVLHEATKPESERSLGAICFGQDWIDTAAFSILITSTTQKMIDKYGEDCERFLYQEAGHIAQNMELQAVAVNLANTPIAAYKDPDIQQFLGTTQDPVYIVSFGPSA